MSSDDRDCKDVVTSVRRGPQKGIWSERIIVLLLILCLGSSLNLVIALHRRPSVTPSKEAIKPVTITTEPEQKEAPPPDSASPEVVEAPSEPPPKPVEAPVDPTKKALAELEAAMVKEQEEARSSDRRADALEKSRQAMVAESERWKRRESLIRAQISSLSKKAESIEQQLGNMELERDVLARERDALKAALTKVNRQASFAVLPFKGANGTWQRPIILECSNGTVTLQPRGLTFSMLELNPHIHPKASIVVQAIAREMSVMESAGSPDGAPVVPYLIFIVRPDGIRPYYEARSRLEPLGIAFGYELIPQDLKVEFPDLSDLSTWDGTVPLNVPPRTGTPGAGSGVAGNDSSNPASPRELSLDGFPGSGRIGQGGKADSRIGGQGTSGGDDPSDFIWPSRPGGGRAYGMGALERDPGSRGTRGTTDPLASSGESDGLGGANGLGSPRFSGSPGRRGGLGGARGLGSSGVYATPGDGSTQHTSPGSGNLGRPPASGSNGLSAAPATGIDGENSSTGGLGPLVGEWSGDGPPATPSFELSPTPAGSGGSGSEPASRIEQGHGRIGTNGDSGSTSTGGTGLGSGPGAPAGGSRGRRDLFGSTIKPRTGVQGSSENGNGTAAMPATGAATGSGEVLESPNDSLTGSGLSPSLLNSGGVSGASGQPGSAESSPTGSTSGSTSSNDRPTLSLGGSGSSRSSSSSPSSGFGFALPSSLSPSGNSSGLGSSGSPSTSSANPPSGELDDFIPKPDNEPKPPLRIEAPFEIVVDCQRDGIEILPGGNRITYKTLRAAASSKDKKSQDLLSLHLRALERKRALVDPMIRPVPRIKFIVEAGGDETYLAVRRQLLFSGLDWPMTVQIVEGQASRFLPRELW